MGLSPGFVFLLVFGMLFWGGCQQAESSKNNSDVHLSKTSVVKQKLTNLRGRWYLNEWDLYHTLHFINERELVIDNHIDTVFRFQYELQNDTLILYDKKKGQALYFNPITAFDEDNLVFEQFIEKSGQQHYTRKPFNKHK
ncbi:MAG TPA: hypothetical protein DCM08_04055 [Microscillaceae bacterium]|nr:hypothetical protein [Microscillaceae bacterium]